MQQRGKGLLPTRESREGTPKEEAFDLGRSSEPVKKGSNGCVGRPGSQPLIGTEILWATPARKSLSEIGWLALTLIEEEPPAPIDECLTYVHHSVSSRVLR